jgi:ATP-binding cassette subfamily B protein
MKILNLMTLPTCLRMIAKYYGRSYSIQSLREKAFITRAGVSMLGISDAAEAIGFRTTGVKTSFEQLAEDLKLPCILHWNQNHFVVCYAIKKRRNGDYEIKISDPAGEKYTLNKEEFLKCWLSTKSEGKDIGTALLLEPTPDFYTSDTEDDESKKSLRYFFRYLRPINRN